MNDLSSEKKKNEKLLCYCGCKLEGFTTPQSGYKCFHCFEDMKSGQRGLACFGDDCMYKQLTLMKYAICESCSLLTSKANMNNDEMNENDLFSFKLKMDWDYISLVCIYILEYNS